MKKLTGLILITLLSTTIHIYGQGPKAPEAGSFEPVDATDMVNLLTGILPMYFL